MDLESTFSGAAANISTSSLAPTTITPSEPAGHKRQCSSISELDFNLILNNKKSFQQLQIEKALKKS